MFHTWCKAEGHRVFLTREERRLHWEQIAVDSHAKYWESVDQTKEIVGLYDKQISFIGIARTLGITVKEVLAVLRANNRIWEPR